jgi:hypothetical protein
VEPADDVHQMVEEQHIEAHYYPQLPTQTRFHSQSILQHHPTAAGKTNEEVQRCDSIRDKQFDPLPIATARQRGVARVQDLAEQDWDVVLVGAVTI